MTHHDTPDDAPSLQSILGRLAQNVVAASDATCPACLGADASPVGDGADEIEWFVCRLCGYLWPVRMQRD